MSCFPNALRLLALLVLALLPASAEGLGETVAHGPPACSALPELLTAPHTPVVWDGDSEAPVAHATEVSELESEEEKHQEGPASLHAVRSAGRARLPMRLVRTVGARPRPACERVGRDIARGPPAPLA